MFAEVTTPSSRRAVGAEEKRDNPEGREAQAAPAVAGLFVAGILITSDSRSHVIWSASIAVLWLIFAVLYALDPTNYWKIQTTYFILLIFHATILWVLLRYIFASSSVAADVLYAAAAVYFLLSFLFVPIYGMLEIASPGSFVDNSLHQPVAWQQLVYYSLITLSTAGYGDVLPVNPWARMLAGIEVAIGVLYVAVLMARLVGLYDSQRQKNAQFSWVLRGKRYYPIEVCWYIFSDLCIPWLNKILSNIKRLCAFLWIWSANSALISVSVAPLPSVNSSHWGCSCIWPLRSWIIGRYRLLIGMPGDCASWENSSW